MGNVEFMLRGRGFGKKYVYAMPMLLSVELYMYDLLMVGAGDGDNNGESDFYRGVHGGYHGVCVEISHSNDNVMSCEDVSLRRCDMMCEPSGFGMSVGGIVAYSDVMLLADER